jgi:hypothetical protein
MGTGHRTRSAQDKLIALSVSYQRDELLARGLGFEHLKELVQRLARPLIRRSANLAYGGKWDLADPHNITLILLRLISAEQDDNTAGGADTTHVIGHLISHAAWPNYLAISPGTEAQWINCCRIVRTTQTDAGVAADDLVADAAAGTAGDRARANRALAMTRMRSLMMQGTAIDAPDVPPHARTPIPPVSARIVLGGKLRGFSGFAPGIFEEAVVAMERRVPLYILGGFGGAAAVLARAFLDPGRPEMLTAAWHEARDPGLADLNAGLAQRRPLPAFRSTARLLDDLWGFARRGVGALNTGLDAAATRELMTTCDLDLAVELVKAGLQHTVAGLESLGE